MLPELPNELYERHKIVRVAACTHERVRPSRANSIWDRASLALACVSALGIAVGGALGHYLPLEWIKRVAAVGFIVIGVLILLDKF